jgi:hypothetical protein
VHGAQGLRENPDRHRIRPSPQIEILICCVSFIPSDLLEYPAAAPVPRGLFEPLLGMVGGDAVALTVPEAQRCTSHAVSDLLPSDLSGHHVRVVAGALLHVFRPQGGMRLAPCLMKKEDHEF